MGPKDNMILQELKLKVDFIDDKVENGNPNAQDIEDRLSYIRTIICMEQLRLKDVKQKAKIKWASLRG